MKKVVIVNGKPRVGKDTSVQFMRGILKEYGIRTEEFSAITPILVMLERAGIDISSKTPEDRALLAEMKAALEKHSKYPTKECLSACFRLFEITGSFDAVMFIYMREPECIAYMRQWIEAAGHEAITIVVESNRAENVTSNSADTGVYGMDYDAKLSNHSTLPILNANCRCLLHSLGLIPNEEAALP